MPRYFRIEEAEKLLPQVERLLREAISLKADYLKADEDLNVELRRIAMLGGSLINREQILGLKALRDTNGARLKEALEGVQQTGCEIKDLDIGLIDFLTVFEGQEVYLCWKLGEEGISFWHGLEEGFRGRKAIDADFLTKHGPQRQ